MAVIALNTCHIIATQVQYLLDLQKITQAMLLIIELDVLVCINVGLAWL